MIKHTQTKVSIKDKDGKFLSHGNCFQTTIACLLDLPIHEVPNVETLFDIEGSSTWYSVMWEFCKSKGHDLCTDGRFKVFHDGNFGVDEGTRFEYLEKCKDKYYMVSGLSSRGLQHVCIYQNGKLVWDVHPSREGILTEEIFESLDNI